MLQNSIMKVESAINNKILRLYQKILVSPRFILAVFPVWVCFPLFPVIMMMMMMSLLPQVTQQKITSPVRLEFHSIPLGFSLLQTHNPINTNS